MQVFWDLWEKGPHPRLLDMDCDEVEFKTIGSRVTTSLNCIAAGCSVWLGHFIHESVQALEPGVGDRCSCDEEGGHCFKPFPITKSYTTNAKKNASQIPSRLHVLSS